MMHKIVTHNTSFQDANTCEKRREEKKHIRTMSCVLYRVYSFLQIMI